MVKDEDAEDGENGVEVPKKIFKVEEEGVGFNSAKVQEGGELIF